GMGGVGSWAVESLARAGVGKLTLVDGDVSEESNTNRQCHAIQGNYGRWKAELMGERGKTAGTHDDQVGGKLVGFLGDHFIRSADPIGLGHRNVVALQNLAGRSENLVGFLFVVAVKRFASYEAAGAGRQRNLNVQQLNRRIVAQNR
ncbi:hypothetical protein DW268_14990, partial [Agathobacter rectalis]